MRIYKEPTTNFRYVFDFPFTHTIVNHCRDIKLKVGRQQFNFIQKKWRFNDLNIVTLITTRCPGVAVDMNMMEDIDKFEIEQKQLKIRLKKAEKLKKATDSDINIVGTKGDLYPYQKVGVEFLINNDGKAILADTMGLGKTLQTLAYISTEKLKKTLVVAPASVKYVWEKEVKKWTKLSPIVIESKSSLSTLVHASHDVFIINYDILKRFFNEIHALRWDCLVCDEFHYIKNSAAQRTKLTKIIASNIPRILLLSGTPLLSRPVELFNGLSLMDPVKWNDWFAFTKRYCGGKQGYWGGWEAKGATNIEELQSRISRYFLRRKKEEVLTELPPKTFIDVPVEMNEIDRHDYEAILNDFQEYLEEVKGNTDDETKKSSQANKLVKLNKLRQATTAAKYNTALEMITDMIDNGEKVVVFSVYNDPLNKLKEKFKSKAVLLTGKTDKDGRKNAVEKFQENDKVRLFLGGMKSAGVGITLTAASNVLFIDYSWVPADHEQAADRIHRIGQTAENVTIYQLYVRGTIDAFMQEMLEEKKELFKRLIDEKPGGTNIKENMVNSLLALLAKKDTT